MIEREVIRIEDRKSGKKRIVFDTGESCTLYAREAEKAGLSEHVIIGEDAWQEICRDLLLPRAKKRALYLIGRMDRTEYQVSQKLEQDGYPEEIREEVIRFLGEYHYIDDFQYACDWIRAHEKSQSKRRMQDKLREKGLRPDVIAQAFEEAYAGDAKELIRSLLEKKGYDPGTTDRKEKNKIFQSLMRKGFTYSEICNAMELSDET